MGWEEVFNKHGLKTNLEKTEVMWVGHIKQQYLRISGRR